MDNGRIVCFQCGEELKQSSDPIEFNFIAIDHVIKNHGIK